MGTDPVSLAGMAQMTGDRDELGTNWNFVGKALAASGMGGTESIKPSAAYIAANAAAGNPYYLVRAKEVQTLIQEQVTMLLLSV